MIPCYLHSEKIQVSIIAKLIFNPIQVMPKSKLRKALGAMKDQTSLSLAKVYNNASVVDIAILKATTHDECPTEDRYINDVLQLVASSKAYCAACVISLTKRIGKTRNWVVALKSLILVLKIFQDGDPHFPCEIFHAMKQGAKILNLSGFRDDSHSSPWDYTSFVRAFALYLDERLDCFLKGKLQKKFTRGKDEPNNVNNKSRRANEPVRDMKPAMLLDRISYWQRLIDRIVATRPTGAAQKNSLVQISLFAVVQESFDLYRDISDGLALLLDSFFHLQYHTCVSAYQTCVKASKQFEELGDFYALCKGIGVGRSSEYPSVQKISDELVETLQEFLKDQSSFPSNGFINSPQTPAVATTSKGIDSCPSFRDDHDQDEICDPTTEKVSELGFQRSFSEISFSANLHGSKSMENMSNIDTHHQEEEILRRFESTDWDSTGSGTDYWDLVLAEITTSPLNAALATPFNPFLQDSMALPGNADVEIPPTFTATPTFSANEATKTAEYEEESDPFGPISPARTILGDKDMLEGSIDRENLLLEQQLWLEHQNKIIAKNLG